MTTREHVEQEMPADHGRLLTPDEIKGNLDRIDYAAMQVRRNMADFMPRENIPPLALVRGLLWHHLVKFVHRDGPEILQNPLALQGVGDKVTRDIRDSWAKNHLKAEDFNPNMIN